MGIGHLQVLTKGISHVTASPVATLGDRVMYNGGEYVYFYNRSSDLTAKVGDAVQVSSQTGWSCVISHITGQAYPVGVVQHVDVPVGEYGWALARGFGTITAGINTTLDQSDLLILVATSNTGNISRKTLASATSNEAFRLEAFGCVVVATGTAGAGKGLIWCA